MDRAAYINLPLQEKADFVLGQLKKDYPTVETPLTHKNAFELLIATMLSPQTNDNATNLVTPVLFKNYPDVNSLANAEVEDIENILKTINYYKTKAKRIIEASQILKKRFNGEVPKNLPDLLKLPGVGRKVGNVVLSEWYGRHEGVEPEGFVVDTHVLRVAQKLMLTKNSNPIKVEQDLMKIFPKQEWRDTSLRMIFHGREVAQARNPQWNEHEVWRMIYK